MCAHNLYEAYGHDDPRRAAARARWALTLIAAAMHARALALITVSVLAIALAGIAYLHPTGAGASHPPPGASSYQLAAVDFVSPTTGWVAATLESGAVWVR